MRLSIAIVEHRFLGRGNSVSDRTPASERGPVRPQGRRFALQVILIAAFGPRNITRRGRAEADYSFAALICLPL